ncbi:MAG: four-carbon acid sugar kinase family protein [Bacteroidetes bacterium]|nr:four-carbon acid sugar kinase family protein [Bacteroidota bacterium]
MAANKKIVLAFYGDDFTGSTDALEFICRAGAKAILFIEPPTAEQLRMHPDLDAYGVAGKTRALPPVEMEKILLPAFEQMKASGARYVHYKVCSTFDSSPTIGSIGKAIDCGATVFNNTTIPVLGGMPALGRFCVFGNLFAKMGIGSEGKIYRLDRHPSMSKHPVTPADESDLRIHLGKQTNKQIGLIDIIDLKKNVEEINKDESVVLIDALNEQHLLKIGEWIALQAKDQVQFCVGSSGIELALGKYWNEKDLLKQKAEWPAVEKTNSLLVISGSCSPVTAAQIAYAKTNGFEEVIIDAEKICTDDVIEQAVFDAVNHLLQQQKNVIVHTGEKQINNLSAEKLGTALGYIAKTAAAQSLAKRIVVAGGDTSSYAARAMDIEAVEMIAPLIIGAPLCKVMSKNKWMHGVEVNFKGGQVGGEDYFVVMVNGE